MNERKWFKSLGEKGHIVDRIKKWFALFPVTLPLVDDRRETRWLEFVYTAEKYERRFAYDDKGAWYMKYFVTKEDYDEFCRNNDS